MRKLLSGILAIALLAGAPAALAQGAVAPHGAAMASAELAAVEGGIGLIEIAPINFDLFGFAGLVGPINWIEPFDLVDVGPIDLYALNFDILGGLVNLVGSFF